MPSADFWSAFAAAHLQVLGHGLSGWGAWEIVAYTLATTHVTIAAVTIFLHRAQAHRALDLHPAVSHFFRLWLWLGTGIDTRQWVAVHRKHHARCETADDPHSPQTRGLKAILLTGTELYRAAAQDPATLAQFGRGTPDDWLERNLYARFSWQGVGLTLLLDLFLFGAIGAAVWAVQMLWIPVTAAGIVNGIGHWWGYRSFETPDASRNFMPWGVLIGGEELHNNHHTYPTSAKLSVRRFEVDIGWIYIRAFEMTRLATVHRRVPRLRSGPLAGAADAAVLAAVVAHRHELMARYAHRLRCAARGELRRLRIERGPAHRLAALRHARPWLHRDAGHIPVGAREQVALALSFSPRLRLLVEMRERLSRLWTGTNVSAEHLVAELQAWLREAELSGVATLQEFAARVRSARV